MKKYTFLSLFKLKVTLPLLALFAMVNGLWSSSLLIIINNKMAGTPLPFFNNHGWMVYSFFVVISFLLTYFFKGYMIKITLKFSNEILLSTIDKLRNSNYESYLKLGEARIRTAMKDVEVLRSFPHVFIDFFNAAIMIIVTIGYMFWIYPKAAILIIIIIVLLSFLFMYRNSIIEKNMDLERNLEDSFMRNYNDFLHGFNKIKMSTKRSNSIYFDHIKKNRDEAIKLNTKSELAALSNDLSGDFSFYFIIGVILFLMPAIFEIDKTIISSFMVALLFLMNPLGIFISHMKEIISYKIALARLNEFNEITDPNGTVDIVTETTSKIGDFKALTLKEVKYHYLDEKGAIAFELKPTSLKINKGEVIFIRGGNGSGKSTFVNLLTGLYIPKSGEILFNDILITDTNRALYRDTISCIFSDNYTFTENYNNFNLNASNKKLTTLLNEMELDKVIRIDGENNKIFQKLSSGQQKRLALIYSVLENNSIFIFDEWAAEQDPYFRKYFYETIIPDLKSKGKTVIAITHDDAYYSFCDRLIKFDYGKLLEENKKTI